MTSRFRFVCLVGSLALGVAGCGEHDFHGGPIDYKDHERFSTDLKDKPNLRAAVKNALVDLFGENPQKIKTPSGSGLPNGGIFLAGLHEDNGVIKRIAYKDARGDLVPVEGGYALYRKHCLHCHGVSGAGDGPTAPFLYPIPRDYRRGVFKFTSTNPTNAKPTREDLAKTLRYGLHGTSMPAFESLMTEPEIQQVIDYVIFLSMRGEVEKNLIDEASLAEDGDAANALSKETVADLSKSVFASWQAAESQVVRPKARRTPSSRESILRGRDLFLGINRTGNKLECASCHGLQAVGDGTNFVEKAIFDKVVFGRKSLDKALEERYAEALDLEAAAHGEGEHGGGHAPTPTTSATLGTFDAYKERLGTTWKNGSLDDWGNPLRPANLNLGVYKGGRRPIDLYWRIAKGINYAKMPAHNNLLSDEQIWDVVNFVLALPYQPELLRHAEQLRKEAGVGAQPTKVTQR